MNKDGMDEKNKNFHLHALRYYMPTIVQDIWEKKKLGVHIFQMEGYRQYKKKSKAKLKNFSNLKKKKKIISKQ